MRQSAIGEWAGPQATVRRIQRRGREAVRDGEGRL
jgi:hypothetical protein